MRKGLFWKTASVAATALIAVCAPLTLHSERASADTQSEFPCTYTAAAKDTEYVCYGSSAVNMYTAAEASAAGIPEGYTDNVLEVVPLSGGTSCGVLLDFYDESISVATMESITFRIYIGSHANNTGGKPQVRIAKPNEVNSAWVWQPGETPTTTGEWTDVTVPTTQANFSSIVKDGYLNKFELSIRSNAQVPFYIDCITINQIEDDGVAPVITYTGEDTIRTTENAVFSVEATAYDALENRSVEVEQIWQGEDPTQEGGTLKQGTYTLILRATDAFGNVAEKILTVVVEEADVEAPVIGLNFETMYVTTGTIPVLQATATDNSGEVELSYAWSTGALDEYGKLTAGTHTWTVTAKDPSGNTSEKIVTVIVTDEEDLGDNVVDEEESSRSYTVTFDGENERTYTYGWKVERPADPTKEAEGITYTFIGWYNGEEKWDFDTDVVTGNLQLVSKWEESVSTYTVTFNGTAGEIYEHGSKLKKPADPTKDSTVQYTYEFDGWYNGDTKWNFDTDVVKSDLALVAKFTEEKRAYLVTFDGENGVSCYYGDKIEKPEDPTKEGHEFIAWYKGTMKWDFDKYTVTGDMDLTAKWKQVQSATGDGADGDTAADGEKDGCGSVIGMSAVGLTLLGAAAICLKKKEK